MAGLRPSMEPPQKEEKEVREKAKTGSRRRRSGFGRSLRRVVAGKSRAEHMELGRFKAARLNFDTTEGRRRRVSDRTRGSFLVEIAL